MAGGDGMYVLATGGLGYIGTHTVVQLLEKGYRVAVMDSCANASPVVLKRVAEIVGREDPVKYFKLDLATEGERLKKVFAEEKFDAVIHYAGLKAVGESVAMPLEYYHNNLLSTINLLTTMREVSLRA